MCLFPRIIKNPKYKANKKNGGIIPAVNDERVIYVPIGCNKCIECKKQRSREWQTRLQEDIKTNKNGKVITLTFSNESIKELSELKATKNWPGMEHLQGYELDNEIATRAMRLFNERWRKKFKKAVRHWFVTELGHKNTENIHLHGIIWTNESFQTIREIWKYGWIWPKPEYEKYNYVNARTINYNVKYITKRDKDHKSYNPIILTSPGIGKNYITHGDATRNKYKEIDTDETYKTNTGHKIALPIYWRNKIYTDDEKEKLWIKKLDEETRYVLGQKIDVSKDDTAYYKALKTAQRINKQLGYGDDKKNWKREQYEMERRKLLQNKRIQNAFGGKLSKRDTD